VPTPERIDGLSPKSFYWHDYETFGRDPRWCRPSQFAGIRTDAELNVIGDPLVMYCQPGTDVLPEPEACMITGITPQLCLEKGEPEYRFAAKIFEEFIQPGTCAVGYNSIRFDDEFSRYLFYRNFYDPYEREWRNGNSRWDLIDVVRMTRALRPEGLNWPDYEDGPMKGRPCFKLEELTKANGIGHESAHDALSDVMATIGLAKLVREHQPRLFDYALSLRNKKEVATHIDLQGHQPFLHVSAMLGWEQGFTSLMMPVCAHPTNSNGMICFDLRQDPQALLDCSEDELRERIFTRQAELPEGVERVAIKTVHLNKSPMVATPALLDAATAERLGIDVAQCLGNREVMLPVIKQVAGKVSGAMQTEFSNPVADPEFRLYDGFLSNADKGSAEQVRQLSGEDLAAAGFSFEDTRMSELLFRYRARNFPETLTGEEMLLWDEFREHRLSEIICDGYLDLDAFHSRIYELEQTEISEGQRQLLYSLSVWADQIL
jgi:exodeoxyribonuclease-1